MSKALTVAIILVAVTALGIVGSLYDLDDKIAADFPILAPYIEKVEILFISLLLLMSAALFYYLFISFKDLYFSAREGELKYFNRGLQFYVCEDVRPADLAAIQGIYNQTTDGATSIDTAQLIYDRCKKGWKKIIDTRTGKIVGYFVVLPLSKKGVQALHNREFNVTPDKIELFFNKRHSSGCCAYIGMIGAETKNERAKKAALARLKSFVDTGNYSCLYARAVTKHGLRLLKRRGFQTIFEEDHAEIGVYFRKHAQNN